MKFPRKTSDLTSTVQIYYSPVVCIKHFAIIEYFKIPDSQQIKLETQVNQGEKNTQQSQFFPVNRSTST